MLPKSLFKYSIVNENSQDQDVHIKMKIYNNEIDESSRLKYFIQERTSTVIFLADQAEELVYQIALHFQDH